MTYGYTCGKTTAAKSSGIGNYVTVSGQITWVLEGAYILRVELVVVHGRKPGDADYLFYGYHRHLWKNDMVRYFLTDE